MNNLAIIEPIDYLVIGHITQDVIPGGFALGGTSSYSALTALAFGLRVGIVTACAEPLALPELEQVFVIRKDSPFTTTFENRYLDGQRQQHLLQRAQTINPADIPPQWRETPIVHLGPVACELDPELVSTFPHSFVGVTPQGWLRSWDADGRVSPCQWSEAQQVLSQANAAILSLEDVDNDEDEIQEFAEWSPILGVTEGADGARIYWNRDIRSFRAPHKHEVDATGAGDVFATCFFIRYVKTRDPWESARFATLIASNSVTRKALQGVPTPNEVKNFTSEVVSW